MIQNVPSFTRPLNTRLMSYSMTKRIPSWTPTVYTVFPRRLSTLHRAPQHKTPDSGRLPTPLCGDCVTWFILIAQAMTLGPFDPWKPANVPLTRAASEFQTQDVRGSTRTQPWKSLGHQNRPGARSKTKGHPLGGQRARACHPRGEAGLLAPSRPRGDLPPGPC